VGPNYFFSDTNEGVQCQHGLAFQIDVQRGIGLPPNLNQPPPPPYAEPPGADSVDSPPITIPQTPSRGAFARRVDLRVVIYGFCVAIAFVKLW